MIPYATYYILNTSPDWEGFPAPSLQHRLLIGLPIIFFGMLLLSPHRWMKLRILFYSKFSILTLFSICLFVGGLLCINAYLIHDKHWMLVFFSLTAIILSICSPLTLWMKKKIGEI
jgi:phosphatidylserine synthase